MTQPAVSELSPAKRALREARLRGRYQAAPIVPRAQTEDAPLSHAQERLWFLDRMYPGLTTFNLVSALRLGGELDAGVLERALAEMVRRHDTLRTTFREVDGVPLQNVAPFRGFALAVDDLSELDPADREVIALVAWAVAGATLGLIAPGPVGFSQVAPLFEQFLSIGSIAESISGPCNDPDITESPRGFAARMHGLAPPQARRARQASPLRGLGPWGETIVVAITPPSGAGGR